METLVNTEAQILKNIAAGNYRNCYLVYGRKSTDEPDSQKNSIKYQRAENTRFALRERLPIAPITIKGFCVEGIISERHSGFKENSEITMTASGMIQYSIERPKFQRLVRFLSKNLFKGIIVLCWDRISRNRGDNTVIRKLMKNGIDVRFVHAKYDKTSAGALHMDIDGMFAEHHARVTAEKVTLTMQNLRDRGICTYKAPMGYLNTGTMEHKPFDPLRSPIIKQMFELLASNEWSLSDLTTWANSQGLTSVPSRRRKTRDEMLAEEDEDVAIEPVSRPMTLTMVHKILTNPFYTGKILGNEGEYQSSKSHEALVTDELFAKAQKVLRKRRVSVHYAEKIDLPYRGLLRCAECARVYTPYVKKGIQYFNARCRRECTNSRKNFNLLFVEREVGAYLKSLCFAGHELAEIEARTTGDTSTLDTARRRRLEQADRRKRKLREDLAFLRDEKLSLLKSGVYSPASFLTEENKLNSEINVIEETEAASEVSVADSLKDLLKLSELLKTGSAYYSSANSREKQKIMGLVISELLVSQNTLHYQCKNGFSALQSRFRFVHDHTGWLSELVRNDKSIKSTLESLSILLSHHPTTSHIPNVTGDIT